MEELKKELTKVFREEDATSKGYLTKEDYKVAVIRLLGYKPSKQEIQSVWKGAEQEAWLTLDQFTDLVLPKLRQRDKSEHIRQVFLSFDRFCHGFVSLEDCRAAFTKVQIMCTCIITQNF